MTDSIVTSGEDGRRNVVMMLAWVAQRVAQSQYEIAGTPTTEPDFTVVSDAHSALWWPGVEEVEPLLDGLRALLAAPDTQAPGRTFLSAYAARKGQELADEADDAFGSE